MKTLVYSLIIMLLFSACDKERKARVDIYLLKSHSATMDPSTVPYTHKIENPVLEDTPLIEDQNIDSYDSKTSTFKLKKDVNAKVKGLGPDKAFAVTVDGQAVYYGKIHPGFMSSLIFGLATIDPLLVNKEIQVNFVNVSDAATLKLLDRRNDPRILRAFKGGR